MKKRVALLAVFLSVLFTGAVHSQDSGTGIGIILGEPTGLSVKVWQTANAAMNFGLAWSFSNDTDIHFHADWLRHNWTLIPDRFDIDVGRVPLYYGLGGRLGLNSDTKFGIRFVLGAAYIPDRTPVDFFIEIAPILDLVPDTELDGNVGIGVRLWF